MRILFISAFYPPYGIGGWEQLVEDINLGLQKRGHTTAVLTSNHGVQPDMEPEKGISRTLYLENNLQHYSMLHHFLRWHHQTQCNLVTVQNTIERFQPDVIFVHGMWNLTRGVPWMVEQVLPERVVYYLASDWPWRPTVHATFWNDPSRHRYSRKLKQLLARLALAIEDRETSAFQLSFPHVLCVSKATRHQMATLGGISEQRMKVVYNGIDPGVFVPNPCKQDPSRHSGLALLYAGVLGSHKGVHTAIEAMALLAKNRNAQEVTLTIAGTGNLDYESHLKHLVEKHELEHSVRFLGSIPRQSMPKLLSQFDVLVFPSIWNEPLARIVQEAMAVGLVVVGTTTGGTAEILRDGETGLTFEPEDPVALAERIEQLNGDPLLKSRLAKNARRLVLDHFNIDRMIEEIEEYLAQVDSGILVNSVLTSDNHSDSK